MISEKAGKFINDFAVAVMNNSRTLSAEYIEQEEAAEKALVDYIADLEAENAELRSYRDGYNTNEKLPEEGQKVLVEGALRADGAGNPRVYERKDGGWAASFEVVASSVKFLSGKDEPADEVPF